MYVLQLCRKKIRHCCNKLSPYSVLRDPKLVRSSESSKARAAYKVHYVKDSREEKPPSNLQSCNTWLAQCPSVLSHCLGKHLFLLTFPLFPIAKSFIPRNKKELKSGHGNHLQASEGDCYGSQKVLIVRKLLPVRGK